MQLTYYRFPADMPIRDCYDAWEKGREGYESPPADMTDAELEEEWPRQQLCNVRTAKKFLRKYGGGGVDGAHRPRWLHIRDHAYPSQGK